MNHFLQTSIEANAALFSCLSGHPLFSACKCACHKPQLLLSHKVFQHIHYDSRACFTFLKTLTCFDSYCCVPLTPSNFSWSHISMFMTHGLASICLNQHGVDELTSGMCPSDPSLYASWLVIIPAIPLPLLP